MFSRLKKLFLLQGPSKVGDLFYHLFLCWGTSVLLELMYKLLSVLSLATESLTSVKMVCMELILLTNTLHILRPSAWSEYCKYICRWLQKNPCQVPSTIWGQNPVFMSVLYICWIVVYLSVKALDHVFSSAAQVCEWWSISWTGTTFFTFLVTKCWD